MKSFIKKVIVLSVVCGIIVSAIAYGSLYFLRKSAFYKPSYLSRHVNQSNFDYIVLGASTGLTTLNTKFIDSLSHTRGINLAMDDTALSTQYLMLQHFLYEGKSTKYCVLAPSVFDFDVSENIMSGNDYRFVMFNDRDYVQNHYKTFEGTEANLLKLSQWVPALGVLYFNVELIYPALQAIVNPEKRNRFDSNGNYVYPSLNSQDLSIDISNDIYIGFKNPYLSKISALCKANDIELVFYISPMQGYKVFTSTGPNNQVINHSDALQNKKYFYDDIHVNQKGRRMVSTMFADCLIKMMD